MFHVVDLEFVMKRSFKQLGCLAIEIRRDCNVSTDKRIKEKPVVFPAHVPYSLAYGKFYE